MASLAEMERGLTVERTCTGLEVARQLELKDRRKRKMTDSKIELAKKLFANGVPPRNLVKGVGVLVPKHYRWIPASAHPEVGSLSIAAPQNPTRWRWQGDCLCGWTKACYLSEHF
jgi:DNA invertase Pin-like site-specific DNA recombinase